MFRVNGSLLLALPFPRPGPDQRGSPTLPVLWRRYDFPPAHPRSLIGFASGAHAVLPRFVSRRGAPEPPEGAAQAGVRCSAGDPFPAAPHVDVSGISQVSWHSIPCLCPGLRPRPNCQPLALTVLSMLPPHPTRRRLRRLYLAHLRTRKSSGEMMRKLSDTLSHNMCHLLGTSFRKKPSTASQKPL